MCRQTLGAIDRGQDSSQVYDVDISLPARQEDLKLILTLIREECMPEAMPLSLFTTYIVFFGFLNTHQRHSTRFAGASETYRLALNISLLLGDSSRSLVVGLIRSLNGLVLAHCAIFDWQSHWWCNIRFTRCSIGNKSSQFSKFYWLAYFCIYNV